jgi:hypothetical protein
VRATLLVLAASSLLAVPAGADDRPAAPDDSALSTSLADDVARLCLSDLGPRWNPSDRPRASQWFADRLEAMKIGAVPGAPGLGLEFAARGGRPAGTNVAGWIPGEDASTYVLLATHVDRAPFDPATKSPGADEASGAAAVLAAAAELVAGPRLPRSVMVVAFDLSGQHGVGARAFLDAPPLPLSGLFGAVVVDRMGRSLGDAWPGLLCVHGAERSAEVASALAAWTPPADVSVARMGLEFFGAHATDAAPFEERKTPVLLVTSGLSRDEGTFRDSPARLDAKALLARTHALAGLVRALAASPRKPAWVDDPAPSLAEATTVRGIVRRGLERDESGPEAATALRRAADRYLGEVIARGTVTKGERVALRVLALQAFAEMSRPPE